MFSRPLTICLIALSLQAKDLPPDQVFAKAAPSVVQVVALDATGQTVELGSGVAIGKDLIVTNHHVVEPATHLQVVQGDRKWRPTAIFMDPERDLVQLQIIDHGLPVAEIGKGKDLRVGQRVYSIGHPMGQDITLGEGLISSLHDVEGGRIVQTSAPISRGSSGGGLFDAQGRLIAITTFTLKDSQNLNFALPAEWAGRISERMTLAGNAPVRLPAIAIDMLVACERLHTEERWEELKAKAEDWLAINHRSAAAYAFHAEALTSLGRFEEARLSYRAALELEPGNLLILLRLGRLHQMKGTYTEAQSFFDTACRLFPDDARPFYYLGALHLALGAKDKAQQALEQSIRLDPNVALTWEALGNTYFLKNDRAKAKEAYLEALRLDPKLPDALYHLGALYGREKNRAKALEQYNRLKPMDPKRAQTLVDTYILP